MGEDAFNLGKFHAFPGDQVVHDAHAGFGHDGQFEVHQMVVVLVDAAGQGVFDGHDGAEGGAFLDAAKDIFKTRTGEDFDVGAAETAGGLLAEGAALPLERDEAPAGAHRDTPSRRRTRGSGKPMRSRTRSMLLSTMSSTDCGW